MDRHLKPIHAFAYRMLGNRCDAEEVAQEVFLRLWKQAPRWRSDALVNTWLHQIAHNLCIDKLRRKREDLPGILPEQPDPTAGPSEKTLSETSCTAGKPGFNPITRTAEYGY